MTPEDLASVTELLGRPPRGACEIAVRDRTGAPVVIRNAPHLADGTPMPTLYWLIGKRERDAVSRLEAAGGVKAAERATDPEEVAFAHERYAAERDRALELELELEAAYPDGDGQRAGRHPSPSPSGGVGGTRQGVKCLHAHVAWHLAGGNDPIGAWTVAEIGLDTEDYTRE